MAQKGDLRVWWIPQVPMKCFHVSVASVDQAILLLETLARYDQFQLDNNIKPDYCNAGGLEQYDPADIENGDAESGWTDWYSADGDDIDHVIAERDSELAASVEGLVQ